MPWLLATDTASTPACRRTVTARAGARNVNSFGCGVPRSVIAVSRLSTARSADRRTSKALPRRPDRAAAAEPSKCTSPANARTAGPPPDRRDWAGAEDCDEDDDDDPGAFRAALRLAEGEVAPTSAAGCAAQAVSATASTHST